MQIEKRNGKRYFVFKSENAAWAWEWLFVGLLGMKYACYGGYYNAFTRKGN